MENGTTIDKLRDDFGDRKNKTNIENNQINIAHFLSYFVNKYETNNTDYILPEYSLFEETTFSKIF